MLSDNVRFRIRLSIVLIGGALLAASPWTEWISFDGHSDISAFTAHIITAIGEAMTIAAVIAIVVDEAAKQKLIKELVNEFISHVSDHIVGRLLPGKLREQMHQYLIVDFARQTWDVTYDLRWQQSPTGTRYVKLITTSDYVMENCSPLDRKYRVGFEVVERWFPHLPGPAITNVTINGESINSGMTKIEGGFLKLDPDKNPALIIPMHGKSPNQEVTVKIKLTSIEYLGDTFYTSFDALYPVLHTKVYVRHPDDMEVALYLSFADNEEAQPVNPDSGITEQWTISQPILPGQGILLRWRPKTMLQS